MDSTIATAHWRGKCDSDPRLHQNEEVAAIRAASRGIAKLIAAECGVSASRIFNMIEGESVSYLTQLRRWVDRALKELPREEALAPIFYLFDRYLATPGRPDPGHQDRGVTGLAAKALGEASEAVQVALAATDDGEVTAAEAEACRAEIEEARRKLALLEAAIESRNGGRP